MCTLRQNADYCQQFQCDYFMSVDQIGKLRSGAFLVYAHYILALSVWPILYWEILDFHHFDVLTCAHWEHFKIGILFRYTFCVRTKTDIRDTQRIAVKKCNSRYYLNVKVFESKLVIQWLRIAWVPQNPWILENCPRTHGFLNRLWSKWNETRRLHYKVL